LLLRKTSRRIAEEDGGLARSTGSLTMHMADALLSPPVGAALWAVSAAMLGLSARRVRASADERLAPLMGVLGAFVFAAQMINFAIPGTGSSGHLGGGLLLAVLLGPWAAFLVMASVLTVQALFFADGGLLALGANIFNLGFLPCFVAYPLVYRPLTRGAPSPRRIAIAAWLAAILGLQLGAFGVVLQTWASGISSLPLASFAALMQPIHLAIGVVEGAATAGILLALRRLRPDLLEPATPPRPLLPVLIGLGLVALLAGGVLSWFASSQSDGLEWSIERAATAPLTAPAGAAHEAAAALQARLAVLPDYGLPAAHAAATEAPTAPAWPAVDAGTSLAGVAGGVATLLLVLALAWAVRRGARRR
jgi:cobalt/nickel transport system permease protein